MAKNRIQLVIDGKDNTRQTFTQVERSLDQLEKKAQATGRAMVAAVAGLASVSTLKKLADINSEWVDLSSRVRRVTESHEEFDEVMQQLQETADRTWTPLNETVESFLSMQGGLAELGYSMREQLRFVEAFNNALVVSGAKGDQAASVQYALQKAMAAGVLRGDELNTVIERGGRVAELLAEKLGTTVSGLRAVGAEGKITSAIVYEAVAGSFETLRKEADDMPATVNDAMVRVNEAMRAAFTDEDLMQPLTDSLLELAETLRDPGVQEGLAALASAMVAIAGTAVKAGSEIGDLGKRIGYWMASATGNVSKLDKIEQKIHDVKRSLNNTGLNRTLGSFWYSKEELNQMLKDLEAQREAEIALLTGMTTEQRKAAEERKQIQQKQADDERKIQAQRIADMKSLQAEAIRDAEAYVKELAKTEKKALGELEKAKSAQLETEKRYRDAIKKLRGPSGAAEATYASAQSLRVQASQALARGDIDEAKEAAQAALDVLLQIKEEGGNTYGFEGFANELKKIEDAADKLGEKKAQSVVDEVRANMADIKKEAEELKNMEVSLRLDEKSVSDVMTKISNLREKIKPGLIIPLSNTGKEVAQSDTGETEQAKEGSQLSDIEKRTRRVLDTLHYIERLAGAISKKDIDLSADPESLNEAQILLGQLSANITAINEGGIDLELNPEALSKAKELLNRLVGDTKVSLQPEIAPIDGSQTVGKVRVEAEMDLEPAKKKIYQEGRNSFTDKPFYIDVELAPRTDEEIQQAIKLPEIDAEVGLDESSIAGLNSALDAMLAELKGKAVIPVTMKLAPTAGAEELPAFASGGHVRGPGSGTSDSILARLSNGEFVMRAAAVRKYGLDMLHRMNNMQVPKFASGGLVDSVTNMQPAQAKSIGSLNFHLPGGDSFSVDVAGTSNLDDLHRAALKYGRTRK